MARRLLAARDWSVLAGAVPAPDGDRGWLVTAGGESVAISLRRASDFAFVQSITPGE